MATFTNRATLTYSGGTLVSNTVTGTVNETLTLEKHALNATYDETSRIVYLISLKNTGVTALSGITLTDDLGGYVFEGNTVYPLAFNEGSIAYYINGELQADPTVTQGPPFTVEGLSLPAGANALLVYETLVSAFAPLDEGATITNTVTATAALTEPGSASETVTAAGGPRLSITKSLTPQNVGEDGRITYSFLIENRGNADAVATDDIVIRDTFDPILSQIAVTLDGETLTEGEGYTYNETTGEFLTVSGVVTVPAATYEQNPDGSYRVTPGVALLTVSGTL
ncbi:MAG: hypothetical protein IJW46_06285 [Clostridia bacterium]|nr:hypothetical protein [Clostridia bacterium]